MVPKKKKSEGDSLKDSVKKRVAKSLKPRPEVDEKEKQKLSALIRRDKKTPEIRTLAAKAEQKPALPVKIGKKADKSSERKSLVVEKQKFSNELYGNADKKIRRNALQVKEAAEEEEKRLLEKEKAWETPAIFRRKKSA